METSKYNESIDIWSFGCVIAKMIKGKPFLKSEGSNEQLKKIIDIFGGPKEEDLIGIENRKKICHQTRKIKAVNLESLFPNIVPKELINLLKGIFVYNPNKRMSAMEIMAHPFFDDLRNSEISLNNGKFIVPNLFDFSKKEISMSKQKNLWTKIIPEWSDGYKNLMEFANNDTHEN